MLPHLEGKTSMTLPLTYADISSTIEKVQQQVIPAALVYTTHERWPLPQTQPPPKTPLHISVLDSSFNPPTLAHLALANAPNPFPSTLGYDAKLLLLSVRNADKIPQAGDATLPQRVEMMCLLAAKIHRSSCGSPPNVAVGLVNEPAFIAKSPALRRFLNDRLAELTSSPSPPMHVQLTFLMGSDTLERVLAPRYYRSEDEMHQLLGVLLSQEGDDARIACARRPIAGKDSEIWSLPRVTPYLELGRVAFIDIGETEMRLSSSALRSERRNDIQRWSTATTVEICKYITDNRLYHSI